MEPHPQDFEEIGKYPIIVMINGAGSRGRDLIIVCDSALIDYQSSHKKFPFIVFSPLCEEDMCFDDSYDRLKNCILESIALPYVIKTFMTEHLQWVRAS